MISLENFLKGCNTSINSVRKIYHDHNSIVSRGNISDEEMELAGENFDLEYDEVIYDMEEFSEFIFHTDLKYTEPKMQKEAIHLHITLLFDGLLKPKELPASLVKKIVNDIEAPETNIAKKINDIFIEFNTSDSNIELYFALIEDYSWGEEHSSFDVNRVVNLCLYYYLIMTLHKKIISKEKIPWENLILISIYINGYLNFSILKNKLQTVENKFTDIRYQNHQQHQSRVKGGRNKNIQNRSKGLQIISEFYSNPKNANASIAEASRFVQDKVFRKNSKGEPIIYPDSTLRKWVEKYLKSNKS